MLLRKLLVTYIFVIIVTVLVVSSIVMNTISTTIENEVLKSNELVLDNGLKIFSNFIREMKSVLLDVAINDKIQNILREFSSSDNSLSTENINNVVLENKYVLQMLRKNNAMISVFPMDESGNVYHFDEGKKAYELLNKEKNQWINETLYKNGSFLLKRVKKDGNYVIRLACTVTQLNHRYKTIGILAVDINLSGISVLLYDVKLANNLSPYLVDSQGNILLPYVDHLGLNSEIKNGSSNYSFVTDEGLIVIRRIMEGTDWKLIGIVPKNELIKKRSEIKLTLFLTGAISIILLTIASYYFSYRISKPIIRLSNQMKIVETGKLEEIEPKVYYKGEVKMLYSHFNHMLRRINELIEEVYLAKINEKEAELMALQAQINPHFLYNTLDSINWMALKYNAQDIRQMVTALAKMMRYSLNNGENFVSVKNEFKQVKSYIAIQEIRYRDKFKTQFEIEEEILDYVIIKLLLQPLVENAIVHGFNESDTKGNLLINGFIKDQHLVFEVINDGKMIEIEKIRKLLNPSTQEKPKNYGIRNVNDRLKKQYGDNYGLTYDCANGYTKAIIRIPINKLKEGR